MLSTHSQSNRDYLGKSGNPPANDSLEVPDDLAGGELFAVIAEKSYGVLFWARIGQNVDFGWFFL